MKVIKVLISAALLLGMTAAAFAQTAPQMVPQPARTPSLEESAVVTHWGDLQTSIMFLIKSLDDKNAALAKAKADADALATYWQQYVAGLKP